MTVRDSGGNVQVDFVWGNFPMQPDDDRADDGYINLPQVEDAQWSQARLYTSGLLDPELDNHIIATTGYSNFPAYIENYAGDGDTGLEIKIPNLVRKTLAKASDIVDAIDGLGGLFPVSHVLTASYVSTDGATVRVSAFDADWNNWGGGYPNSQLIGIKVGDELSANLDIDGDTFSFENAKVTAIHLDGENSWFEYVAESAFDPAIDFAATNNIYAGANLVDRITLQRSEIRNEGQQVNVRYVESF